MKDFVDFLISKYKYVETSQNGFLFSYAKNRAIGQCIGKHGYCVIVIKYKNQVKQFKTHRLIWILCNKRMPVGFVDHINGNIQFNKIENLREVSPQQSMFNTGKRKNKTSSIYKGVHFFKRDSKWDAQYRLNGKSHHIGRFDNEKDAAIAYNKKAIEVFGNFARINNI